MTTRGSSIWCAGSPTTTSGTDPEPWSVDDAPTDFIAKQLRAIVGIELVIDRIEAKRKLSQNRGQADVDGAIAGLEAGITPPATPSRT